MTDWKKDYEAGAIILTSRYTTSNAIHQSSKLPEEKREKFLRWLEDFEYNLMGIPRPDRVIFLDMPLDYARQLLNKRYKNDETRLDVHEKDMQYQEECYQVALKTCELLGWTRLSCVEDGLLKSKEENAEEIYRTLKGILDTL
jgi:dTMP kinase